MLKKGQFKNAVKMNNIEKYFGHTAAHLGVKLIEQYSAWQPEKMINQCKEALAALPDGIVIMGHPGEGAFELLVEEAISRGVIITSGNNPLPNLQAMYQDKGFG